ncbi:MAG: hypothetical protein B7Z66_03255 [Chromatiales bacterium 21-64-14]|nr:MAG: hypothetical protein B7Z66_03255 [Chromatiales bacterium 21-64-14]HQU15844.1 cytochrome b/b6 domain-containing protein [Gammaproteobacteria bacterium]
MPPSRWARSTRLLHFGLAITVTLQLLLSLGMEAPHKGHTATGLPAGLFEAHEYIGLMALTIVLIHWAWSLRARDAGGLRHLFPWTRTGRGQVAAELRDLLRRRLPPGGPDGGLAGLVHGLGFLAVTGMALTGGALFVLLPEHGDPGPLTHDLMEVHSFVATFVWVYWFGHLGLALVHHYAGHDTLRAMFRLSDSPPDPN